MVKPNTECGKKKTSKKYKIINFIRFKIPAYLFLQALYLVSYIILGIAFYKSEFDKIYLPLLSIIGLSISLSSCIFSYSRTKLGEEKKLIAHIGENLLFTAISTVFSLIFVWVASTLKQYLPKNNLLYESPSYLIFLISLVYFQEAIDVFTKSIERMYKYLFYITDL